MNWKTGKVVLFFVSTFLFCIACSNTKDCSEEKIMVFAAAGMMEPLTEIIDAFEKELHIAVAVHFASSGVLAKQISLHEIPDVFISANTKWMDYIVNEGFIDSAIVRPVAFDKLVMFIPGKEKVPAIQFDSTFSLKSVIGERRLSIGNPEHVPAGEYAKQALEYYGWYSELEGNLLLAKDVRASVMQVELEEAMLGIAYYTSVAGSGKVKIISEVPDSSYQSLSFLAGLCKGNHSAKLFYNYLFSHQSAVCFEKAGFKTKK